MPALFLVGIWARTRMRRSLLAFLVVFGLLSRICFAGPRFFARVFPFARGFPFRPRTLVLAVSYQKNSNLFLLCYLSIIPHPAPKNKFFVYFLIKLKNKKFPHARFIFCVLFRCLRSEPLSDKRRSRAGDPRCSELAQEKAKCEKTAAGAVFLCLTARKHPTPPLLKPPPLVAGGGDKYFNLSHIS